MLNQHEVGAHNYKVALKIADKLVSKLEECPAPIAIRKPATRSHLPMIDPKARAPRKIFKGAKPSRRPHHNVPAPQHATSAIRSAMPTPVTEQRNVNGALSPQRVPQRVIDMTLVARYLAK